MNQESDCQKDIKEEYRDLGSGDNRARSHPASLLSMFTKTGKSLNSFAILKKSVLAVFF